LTKNEQFLQLKRGKNNKNRAEQNQVGKRDFFFSGINDQLDQVVSSLSLLQKTKKLLERAQDFLKNALVSPIVTLCNTPRGLL
jgi:hypothetical protein